jgi:hypothetical protein
VSNAAPQRLLRRRLGAGCSGKSKKHTDEPPAYASPGNSPSPISG